MDRQIPQLEPTFAPPPTPSDDLARGTTGKLSAIGLPQLDSCWAFRYLHDKGGVGSTAVSNQRAATLGLEPERDISQMLPVLSTSANAIRSAVADQPPCRNDKRPWRW